MKTNQWIGIGLFLMCLVITLPVVHAGTLNLQYDANGNLITGDGKYRVYNGFNQLAEIRNGSAVSGTLLEDYIYHPVEERILIKKVYEAGVVKDTVYYVDENFVRVVNSSGSYDYTYVKHEGQLVAQLNPDGTKYFVHGDHEGSTSVVTDSNGRMLENITYTPYGEILSGGAVSRFDSEGKEYSSYVGDYDFNFRKMKPEWGLFTQPDTLIPSLYDPQSLNRYMFERGNPYKNTDPTGHIFGIDDFVIGLIVIASAIYSGYVLANQLSTIEKENGGLSGKETTLAFLNIATIVFPTSGVGQFVTKAATKFGFKAYIDKHIKKIKEEKNKKDLEKIAPVLFGNPYQEIIDKNKPKQEDKPITSSDTSSNRRSDGSAEALKRFWDKKKAAES